MRYYRYGKLWSRDLGLYWFICAVMFLWGSVSLLLSMIEILEALLPGILVVIISATFFLIIFRKTQERFSIGNHVLTVQNFWKKRDIPLPRKVTIVIAHADLIPPLATRSPHSLHMRQTISLGDGIEAVLLDDSAEEMIPILCRYNYSASHIEEALADRFIYSFVCNQNLLEYVAN